MTKFIPKRLFQLIALISLLFLGIQMVLWIMYDDGLYHTIASQIRFLEDDSLEKTLLAIALLFFALFIPWIIVMLIVRVFVVDMPTLQDEIAYLKGERQPSVFKTPEDRARFMGIIAIVLGVVLLGVNLIAWKLTQDGFIALWIAVPVALVLGIYAVVTGKFPQR